MQAHKVHMDRTRDPVDLVFPPAFNAAAAFLDRHLEEGRGERPALRSAEGDVTYGALAERANRFGNALMATGLASGDRLLMVVRDGPEFFYTFWGAIKSGIIPIPVNTFLTSGEYEFLIENSECAAVVYSPELADVVLFAADDLKAAAGLFLATSGAGSLSDIANDASPELDPAPATPEAECFWLYSSGSTGPPKGVIHRHRDMVVTSERFGQGIVGIREDDIVYCASKLFFSYGFGGGMTFPLWAGATSVITPERTTADLSFDMIERYRPTVFFGVPTLYAQQIHAAEQSPHDMSSIRIAVSAGEALPAHVYEQARDVFGFKILDGIGSTEALHIFISNRIGDVKPGTSGKAVPGYDVRIVDEEGRSCAPEEIGTLHVRGQSNAVAYWKNPDKTEATMLGDWLNTGDMYFLDAEGYYVNAGRGDDMLKVGGMWCSPIEIEAHLIKHPVVLEAAVVGRADEDDLVKPEAFVVLRADAEPSVELEADLTAFCKAGLAGYKYPRWFTFVDEIPKTTTGKIQRFKLRRAQQ